MAKKEKIESAKQVVSIDLNDIRITDLNKLDYTDDLEKFKENVANAIYTAPGSTLELLKISQELHLGAKVEIEKLDLVDIVTIFEHNKGLYGPWVMEQIRDYFRNKLKEFN